VRLLLAACVAVAFLPCQAVAIDVKPGSIPNFQRTTFTVKDGAPDRTRAITQTSDGWIWFGGSTGLVRFDGVEFEKVDVATSDGRLTGTVSTLHALSTGGLMVGHLSGGVSIYERGAFTRFDGAELRAAGRPGAFATGADGMIWGAFESGLLRFDGAKWTRIGHDWDFPDGSVQDLVIDGGGTVWVHKPMSVFRLRQGQRSFEKVAEVEEPSMLIQSPDGDVRLVGVLGNASPARRWSAQPATAWKPRTQPGEAFFDSEGRLWSQLLNPHSDPELVKSTVAGLAEFGLVSQVFEDAEKNIWAAQIGRVHRLRSSAIVPVIDTRQRAVSKAETAWINLTSDKEGAIWFATSLMGVDVVSRGLSGTLWSVKDGAHPVRDPLVRNAIQVAADPSGNVWAAGASGLWERQEADFAKRGEFPGAEWGTVAVAAVCAGGVWAAGAREALRRFDQGTWQDARSITTLPPGIPTALHCDKKRNLWLGYGDGRVIKVDETLATTTFRFFGQSIGAIASISVGRRTLVGGSSGLGILGPDGFVRVSSRLPVLDAITGIVESPDDGTVWLNGARGLIRIWASDLEGEAGRAAGIRTQLFDAEDGFPAPAYSLAVPMSSIALGGDGRVWFSGLGGLGVIDPARLSTTPQPPQVVLKALIVGGRILQPAEAMSLPKGTRSLEIAYTALRSQHPDRLRFRYRLDGVDDDWVNVEQRRRAIYTNLSPGKYQFQLDVSDELGVWSTQPSALTFEIPPTFLESRTFKALCVVVLLALLAVAYWLRVRHLERRHQQLLVERLDERERIARELHDTLLQSTQALIMKVHSATKLVGKDEPIHRVLDKALDQATGVMVEARNRIEDLRVRASSG
jgi:ligand-binding sensor domain-containing protein